MRRSTLFLSLITFFVIVAVFRVKYEVVALEQNNKKVLELIKNTKESIHILKAENSHLNDPKRLQSLATNHLKLQQTKSNQIIDFSDLPTESNFLKNEPYVISDNKKDSSFDSIESLIKDIENNDLKKPLKKKGG